MKVRKQKYGDGGEIPGDPLGRIARASRARGNAQVAMNPWCPPEMRMKTTDPVDRAHSTKDDQGYYVPAPKVDGAKPRTYHPSYITGERVSIETVCDRTEAARRRLEGIPGVGVPERSEASAASIRSRYTRDVLRRGTRIG